MPENAGWPIAVASVVFAVTCAVVYTQVTALTGGSFHYPLDDAYIHMAMAKNLSRHGVWGITPYEFSSASSSLLWTLLLAAVYKLIGVREIAPFVLASLCCFGILVFLDRALRHHGLNPRARCGVLLVTLFCAPLPMLAFSGMEHPLHILLTLAFVYLFAESDGKKPVLLYVIAALLCMARYEGLFLVAMACALLLARRKFSQAAGIALCATAPLLIFAIVSIRQGSYPVPNSVLLKAMLQPGMSLGGFARFSVLFAIEAPKAPHLLLLMALATLLLIRRSGAGFSLLVLFLGTALLHLQFARIGWLYRYEAYLIVLGIYVCARALPALPNRPLLTLLLTVFAIAYYDRALTSLALIPHAAKNIYDFPYRTGLFLRQYYPNETVVLHDIGAPAFLTDCHIIDVYGLGTIEVARARRNGAFTPAWIDRFARHRNAALAIAYAQWMSLPAPPPSWQDTGKWTIPDNRICFRDSIHFYAFDNAGARKLAECLRSNRLPSDIAVTIEHLPQQKVF